jgi:glycosyltransferase involved in cell wall biosynthesis
MIAESACGFSCASGDFKELASMILKMKSLTEDERKILGSNGFRYFSENFTKSKCMNHLIELLEQQ